MKRARAKKVRPVKAWSLMICGCFTPPWAEHSRVGVVRRAAKCWSCDEKHAESRIRELGCKIVPVLIVPITPKRRKKQ